MSKRKWAMIGFVLALALALPGDERKAAAGGVDPAQETKAHKPPCDLKFTAWGSEHPTLYRDTDYTLRWETARTSDKVDIRLLRDGSELGLIAQGVANDGARPWLVGSYSAAGGYASAPEGDGYQVRISYPGQPCATLSGRFRIDDAKTSFAPDLVKRLAKRISIPFGWADEVDLSPQFATSELCSLVGEAKGRFQVLLLKNSVPLKALGTFGAGAKLPAALSVPLGQEDCRQLRADSAVFSLALADEQGRIVKTFPLAAEQKRK